MQPNSIIRFEQLFLLSLLLGLVNSIMKFHATVAQLRQDPALAEMDSEVAIALIAISLLVPLVLWYFVARRGSNIAKWILVVVTAIGLAVILPSLPAMTPSSLIATIVMTGLQLAAIAFLFRSDAVAWLQRETRDPADPVEPGVRLK